MNTDMNQFLILGKDLTNLLACLLSMVSKENDSLSADSLIVLG